MGKIVKIAFVLLIAFIGFLFLFNESSDWKIINKNNISSLTGYPKEYSGPSKPIITLTCGTSVSDMRIHFGVPMSNSHRTTEFEFITVDLQFDNEDIIPLVFDPSQDWKTAIVLKYSTIRGAARGIGVGIDNFIFKALGLGKIAPRSDWTASSLARKMSRVQTLFIRGVTRDGQKIIGEFDMTDFQKLYLGMATKC